ncbi:hypothetical protein, partial [Magnetospirillum sp. LM-5]|uniref:hypothetical protein n=1 Tax=Magnetospirillum sp. LM-5 TaxID=2681466 RepID=UPI001C2CF8F3
SPEDGIFRGALNPICFFPFVPLEHLLLQLFLMALIATGLPSASSLASLVRLAYFFVWNHCGSGF